MDRHLRRQQGRVVQVDPIKPKLQPPGSKRLKLRCVVPLSNFAFKFNLRRYSECIRLGRDGQVDHVIELPVKCPTSLTFGGRDLDTIFVTTRGPDGGSLYAVGPARHCEERNTS